MFFNQYLFVLLQVGR